jgi:hypothetical protein
LGFDRSELVKPAINPPARMIDAILVASISDAVFPAEDNAP